MEEAFTKLREQVEEEIRLFAPDEQKALLISSLGLVNDLAVHRGRGSESVARMLQIFDALRERRLHPGIVSQLIVFGTTTTHAAAMDFVTVTREPRLPWTVEWQGLVREPSLGLLRNHLTVLRLMGSWRCEELALRPAGESFMRLRYTGVRDVEQAPLLLVPFPDSVELEAKMRWV